MLLRQRLAEGARWGEELIGDDRPLGRRGGGRRGVSGARARLELEHGGRVARVRLAPPKANILDRAMIAELDRICASLAGRRGLVAIVVGGDGPNFSFGASVEEHLPGEIAAVLGELHALLARFLELPAPTIAAMRGSCLGGGLELALVCDLILAEEGAGLGQPEIQLGVFPPAASALLPARIGAGPAAELILTGRPGPGSGPPSSAWRVARPRTGPWRRRSASGSPPTSWSARRPPSRRRSVRPAGALRRAVREDLAAARAAVPGRADGRARRGRGHPRLSRETAAALAEPGERSVSRELGRLLERVRGLAEDVDFAAVAEWKQQSAGRKAVGYMPIYVPRELIHAAGMLPVGVVGGGDRLEIIRGDAYFQSYICHIPRSTIELALTGRLDVLDGMLFPSICDVIRNLSGMWQMLFPDRYVRYVDVPQNFAPAVGGGLLAA